MLQQKNQSHPDILQMEYLFKIESSEQEEFDKQKALELFNQQNTTVLQPFDESTIKYINNYEELLLINHKQDKVLGIDIEQSNKISYDGQICLIQIKTLTQTYLLDILVLKEQNELSLEKYLTNIFEDEQIVKVFYGGQQDILWLQRDFNIHVKRILDIKEVADIVNKGLDNSLVGLWKKYCNFEFEKTKKKQFQESDWHTRPLSKEQIRYAAMDCQFLIYLRYVLLQTLLDHSSLKSISKLYDIMQNQTAKLYVVDRKSGKAFIDLFNKYFNSGINKTQSYNKKTIFKFCFFQFAQLRQDIAIQMNKPIFTLKTDEDLFDFCVLFNQSLKIPNIESYKQYYQDIQYQYDISKFLVGDNQAPNKFSMSLLQLTAYLQYQLDTDTEFVKLALSTIYNIEAFKLQQKEIGETKKQKKQDRFLQFQEKFTCKGPVYGGCKIYSPDDIILCVCDKKKAEWYLKQDLAFIVTEEPFTIKLKFQPVGVATEDEKDQEENKFYTASRETQCVVCGAKQNYLKYQVVPVLYKRFFDDAYKSHRSHDIVLLCVRCHEKASASNDKLKDQIAAQFNIPINHMEKQDDIRQKIKQLKFKALAFKNRPFKDPQEKKDSKQDLRILFDQIVNDPQLEGKLVVELEQLRKSKNGQSYKCDDNFIKLCVKLKDQLDTLIEKTKRNNLEHNLHGKMIVDQLKTDKDVEEFIMMWRKHFLDTLNPQFLPKGWSVEHKFSRKFGEKSKFYQK